MYSSYSCYHTNKPLLGGNLKRQRSWPTLMVRRTLFKSFIHYNSPLRYGEVNSSKELNSVIKGQVRFKKPSLVISIVLTLHCRFGRILTSPFVWAEVSYVCVNKRSSVGPIGIKLFVKSATGSGRAVSGFLSFQHIFTYYRRQNEQICIYKTGLAPAKHEHGTHVAHTE